MKQTPMQEAIEKRLKCFDSNIFLKWFDENFRQLLEEEKQVIEDTYTSRCTFISCEETKKGCKCGKDYYNNTFKQK